MTRKRGDPIPEIVAVKLALQREGKLVDLRPRRYRRWPTSKIIERLREIDEIGDVPLPIDEVAGLVAEYDELEDELARR